MNQEKNRHSPRSLKILRERILAYLEKLRDKDGPFGAIRIRAGERCDLYSSVDAALMRAIMGEDLKKTLSDEERKSWTTHINSFVENDFEIPTDKSSRPSDFWAAGRLA